MKKVLYIHGFNSGQGSKFTELSKHFDTVCPILTNSPNKDLESLRKIIKTEGITNIVGTSLGGYYGLILSCEFDLDFHIINPSLNPTVTMTKRLGQTFKNYSTSDEFTVTQNYIDELSGMKPCLNMLNNLYIYLGTEDTLLDFDDLKKSIKSLKKPFTFYESKQGHRHEDISLVIKHIHETL